ncbi:membrane-bound PQQ-dependent dehydrogenase, glucose/quinate/shikimate family [Oceanobacter kriegii]|uniref:membrane-bound PQQ-dependent dehydrogenase, glucose/quinate/shikimate family n=1 Tax=Oceanobacter kriegii TaxID=64972 RepID=UPI000429058B|nr:membrane-bound PQQ-dependent dehydrogenase, glucose/quinate/shikimate family [Oceanobacter kriegii]
MTDSNVSGWARALLWLVGAVFALAGLGLTVGGVVLITEGGSWYYLLMGLAVLASGVLLIRENIMALTVYFIAYAVTVIWAIWEAGFEFWPLHARLYAFTVMGLLLLLVNPILRKQNGYFTHGAKHYGAAAVFAIAVVGGFWGMFLPHGQHNFVADTGSVKVTPATEQKNWDAYGGTSEGQRFAALDDINRDTVKDLQVAWTYRTGDIAESTGNGSEDQETPLQVGNTLFVCTPHNNVIALNAATGEEKWKTIIDARTKVWMRCRGLAYFDADQAVQQPSTDNSTPVDLTSVQAFLQSDNNQQCRQRVYTNTNTGELIALDANTGEFCEDFGSNPAKPGRVDLKAGIGEGADNLYSLTSAPTLAGTTIVVGGRVADNVALDMPGGVVRGFDVITGELKWAFDPGNPDDRQAPTDGQTYTRSTPNVWAGMTYDPDSNTVFMPVGSAAVDLWGVDRTKLDEKYGASVLAVDATTGDEKWVYQTVHHDLWDFDVPMQPTLIDFPTANGKVPAVVVGTKAGQIFVLDRATGKPLTEVKEMPVKTATIPGEKYATTQPVSVGMPQIGTQHLTEADMWGATVFDQMMCRISFQSMRYDGLFTAPDTDVSLSFPGSLGGMNWGGLSYDPVSDLLVVNDMRLGLWVQMVQQQKDAKASDGGEAVNTGMGAVPLKGTPYSVNKNRFLSALGIPCQEPPFGTLTAIDMKTQKVAWEAPLGTVQDTGPFGIKMKMPIPIGMPTIGGSLTTQSGLIFFAATQDYYLRAFDSATGEEVWKARLPVGSQGTPMTYRSPEDGKQYLVISAGGARQSPDRGDYVIAYALPN